MNITGDKPGTTNYTATCDVQEVVGLTAQATITVESVRYEFVRWENHPAGQATIELTMNADRTATAVYAARGIVYVEGPNERGEGPLPPATGTGSLDEFGLLFVDIYAENMPGFAAFQAALDFLDDTLTNAAGSTIVIAYNHLPPYTNVPWGDRQITWNEGFLPQIEEVTSGSTVGLMAMEREWLPFPINQWGDFVDKTITDKTWLMTIGYWYTPDAEGAYTIGADPVTTAFGDTDAIPIPYTVIPGSVTIDKAITHDLTVQSTPITGVNITGDKTGTTDYAATCNDQEVVGLTAPPTVAAESVRYDFVRWDGHPDGQATIEITMDTDRTAKAV